MKQPTKKTATKAKNEKIKAASLGKAMTKNDRGQKPSLAYSAALKAVAAMASNSR